MMSLLFYLRTRLVLLGLAVSLPIIYLVFSLYELGLDDATEGYLKEDILYAQSVLTKTGQMPESTDFRLYYLGDDSLPDLFKLAIKNKRYFPFYIWQTDDEVFYGVRDMLHDKPVYVFHRFPLEESVPGVQLETIVAGLLCLILLMMMFFAAMIYKRISKAMTYLNHASNDPVGFDDSGSEFTEINAIATALKVSVSELERKNIHERYFIQSLSHELRTPMAIIQVAVELLKKQTPVQGDDRLDEKLTTILNANLKMQSLSNHLLSLWSGEKELEKSQVCINKIIIQCMDELAQNYDLKGRVALSLPNERVLVNASLFTVQLVLLNIIKNAIVHSVGVIHIQLTNKHIMITNPIIRSNHKSSNSVGMGLFIVERGIECLGWEYQVTEDDIYRVDITISE
ncbi:sensor histidine kinase [Bermanella sp. WJH001]|uniref:sensor histidine kinase n=1 Tax=Bermanella sp. WJH001 TaxID=3048005 RepID=UPI0024BDA712|nr:HAMP domain-containing sensor histidine kinase [Bermanella sp. WJH001]MDJ1537516.1 HAMP domain-containing sensor histidine kinase [Bermanella sp. WJH001]